MTELPDPCPAPGEVTVRVHATAVNPMDVVFRSGAPKGRMFSRPGGVYSTTVVTPARLAAITR